MINSAPSIFLTAISNHLAGLMSFMIVTLYSFLYVQVNFFYSDSLQSVQPQNLFVWIHDSLLDIHGCHVKSMALTSYPYHVRSICCLVRSMAFTSDPYMAVTPIHGSHVIPMALMSDPWLSRQIYGPHVRSMALTSDPWLSRLIHVSHVRSMAFTSDP
jgi:hypothetical protein